MLAYEIPGLQFSLPPEGAIERYRFVSVDTTNGTGKQATASTVVVGVSTNKVTASSGTTSPANQVLEVADGLVMVEAAAAISAGVAVASDANGKAVTYVSGTTGAACATAMTAATAAGDIITVKIH